MPLSTVNHLVAAERTAPEVQAWVGLAGEVEDAGGVLLVRRPNEVRAPLDVGGDTPQPGVLQSLDQCGPILRIGPEILDFSTEDFSRLRFCHGLSFF